MGKDTTGPGDGARLLEILKRQEERVLGPRNAEPRECFPVERIIGELRTACAVRGMDEPQRKHTLSLCRWAEQVLAVHKEFGLVVRGRFRG